MYAGVSSVSRGEDSQSLGVLAKCSVTNQCSFGQPLNATTSPAAVFGSPFRQASEVSATWMPQLPSRNPICCDPASYQHHTDSDSLPLVTGMDSVYMCWLFKSIESGRNTVVIIYETKLPYQLLIGITGIVKLISLSLHIIKSNHVLLIPYSLHKI